MKVLVGTASWSDKSLVASKKFYPKGVNTPEGRLRLYATQFPLVEVDTSYYAIPLRADRAGLGRPDTGALHPQREGVPALHRARDHGQGAAAGPARRAAGVRQAELLLQGRAADLRDALWQRFKDSLEPLRAAGKLGMVHFQFAPWLLRNRDGRAHVAQCVETMKDYTVSVEFRNRTWFDDAHLGETLAFERELNVVHTVVDGPQGFHNSVPPVWESTHIDYALVRMHGRNHETWNIKGATVASERFDYDYPDAELDAIAARVERLAPETFTTHVVMNNNNEDQGQRNAATLMRTLERRRAARVPRLVAAQGAALSEEEAIERSEWVTGPA